MALAAGILLAAVLVALSTGWTLSTIGDAAAESSMVVDAAGGVHAAFWDPVQSHPDGNSLMYASKGLLGWSLARVYALTSNEMIESTSIAATADGHVWIAFSYEIGYNGLYSVFDTTIGVATNQDGTWAVTSLPEHGVAPSVAVGPNGGVYVALIALTGPAAGGNLTLLSQVPGGWSPTVLTEVGFGPQPYTQVAVDPFGRVHIAFGSAYSFGYTTEEAGGWPITWLNQTTSQGFSSWMGGASMAVDSAGHVHLSFEGLEPGTDASAILYMTNAGGAWLTYPLDRLSLSVQTSIAVEGNGIAHVAWYDQANGTLKYATGTEGAWSTQTVGPAVGGTVPLSIGVGPDGQVHLAFFTFDGLGYATNRVDATNLGAFLVARFFWWVAPAVVCGYSLYRVAVVRRPSPPHVS